jgi:hypothetical protein
MQFIFTLYIALLFFILTPAILVRLPPKGNKYIVAGFHSLVFALVLHFTCKTAWSFTRSIEGLDGCKSNSKYTGKDLNTPNDGTGDQKCGAANKTYCDKLEFNKNKKGFYTYTGTVKRDQCVEVKAPAVKADSCKPNSKYTGKDLNTPNDGTGDQKCGAANKTYCDKLEFNKNKKGFYTYTGTENRTQCVEVKAPTKKK